MRILFFSDWRLQPMEWVDRLIDEAEPVDVILYGGDDTGRFGGTYSREDHGWVLEVLRSGPRQPEDLIQALSHQLGRPPVGDPFVHEGDWQNPLRLLGAFRSIEEGNVFHKMARRARYGVGAVIGNDCYPEDRHLLGPAPVYDLHREPLRIEEWGVVGVEGALVSTTAKGVPVNNIGWVRHDDSMVYDHLDRAVAKLKVDPRHLIVVSHTPPRGCLDVGLRFGCEHLGSPELARFISANSPALVLCGHCHSHGGRVQQVGDTWVVNAASSDNNPKDARAAIIDLDDGHPPRITWVPPRAFGIVAISGIGPAREKKLRDAGITTTDELMGSSVEQLKEAGLGKALAARLVAKGEAERRGRPVWLPSHRESVPADIVLFDVETGLGVGAPHEPWMIGAKAPGAAVAQWIAVEERRKSRKLMLEAFLALVADHGNTVCSWSGSGFDDGAIENGLERWHRRGLPVWDKVHKLDLKTIMYRSLEFPNSWSIKAVSEFLGFAPDESPWDGFAVGLAYELHRQLGEPLDVPSIAAYNVTDVQALAYVYQWYRDSLLSAEAIASARAPKRPRAWTPERLNQLAAGLKAGLAPREIQIDGVTSKQIQDKIRYAQRASTSPTWLRKLVK